MDRFKPLLLVAVVAALIGATYFINSSGVHRPGSNAAVTVTPRDSKNALSSQFLSLNAKSAHYELAKEITTPDGFINTDGQPITISGLIGKKVVLVDFWTYSCINCQRTTPYLNAWYEKYRDKGLIIIGVHTPEFEFEKNYDNVKAAVGKFGIKFPVVLDNDYSTWTAYKNRYWPRKYLIDIDGYIVYDHIGEGGYDETELHIQQALNERMAVLGVNERVASGTTQPQGSIDVDFRKVASPETYFGSARNQNLGNGTTGKMGEQHFTEATPVLPNTLYLAGSWNIQPEYAENTRSKAKITFRYSAKSVYFVASSERGVTLSIQRDGKPLGDAGGKDMRTSTVFIQEDRLYHLVENPEGYSEHILEITIENSGLKAFTLTFG